MEVKIKLNNCYYLKDSAEKGTYDGDETLGDDNVPIKDKIQGTYAEKDEDSFNCGEVAWLLQNAVPKESGMIWGQAINAAAGDFIDDYPILTAESSKKVHKITFSTKANSEFAIDYANPAGITKLPNAPESTDNHEFIRWSQTDTADYTAFDTTTQITDDMTVYAVGTEKYGEAEGEKLIKTVYGTPKEKDLHEYIVFAEGSSTANAFTYTINSGNDKLGAVIDDTDTDLLKISSTAPAGTYTLSITAALKDSSITLFSVSYDSIPVTFNVKVEIEKAVPDYTVPDNLKATVGQILDDVILPNGFTWTDKTQGVGDVGTNPFTVTFIPEDTDNYKIVENIPVDVQVSAAATEIPTTEPTVEPTSQPTVTPAVEPTPQPTAASTVEPTTIPTTEPTVEPTAAPIINPTVEPTAKPTEAPTLNPTSEPITTPAVEPSATPTETLSPTSRPSSSGGHRTYKVVFNTDKNGKINEGKSSLSVYVSYGTKVKEALVPKITANEGYKFIGWSEDGKTAVDPSTIAIKKTITFKAIYEAETSATPNPTDKSDGMPTTPPQSPGDSQHDPYIVGYDDGTFQADGNITRAETAVILARLTDGFDENSSYISNFSDIDESVWYSRYIGFNEQHGIMDGYDDNTARPLNSITRGEFTAMIARYAKLAKTEKESSFSDTKGHWAQEYINMCYEAGYLEGYENNTCCPKRNITRAEAVTIVNRMLKRVPNTKSVDNSVPAKYKKMFPDVTKSHWGYYDIIEASTIHNISDFH